MADQETDKRGLLEEAVDRDIADIFEPVSDQLEVTERLDRLRDLGIGRAFVHIGSNINMLMGYSLPLNAEQSQHIVLFGDGEVIVTEADGDYSKLGYGHEMGPSEVPFNFNSPDLALVKRAFMFSKDLKSRIIMRSSNMADIPAIQQMIEQGLEMGVELKEERERALRESPQMVINTVGHFLERYDAPPAEDPEG